MYRLMLVQLFLSLLLCVVKPNPQLIISSVDNDDIKNSSSEIFVKGNANLILYCIGSPGSENTTAPDLMIGKYSVLQEGNLNNISTYSSDTAAIESTGFSGAISVTFSEDNRTTTVRIENLTELQNSSKLIVKCFQTRAGESEKVTISIFSSVTGTNKEVKTGTVVTISCTISDISQAPTSIVWKTSGKADLSNVTGYTVVLGQFDSNAKKQTTTLTLSDTVNNEDSVYTCDVTPSGGTVQSADVTLDVFAVTGTNKEVKTGTVVTISCTISDISQAPTSIIWKTSGKADLSNVTGYTVVLEKFDSNAKSQTTTLTLSDTVNNEDSIYTCDVTPSGGTVQSTDVILDVFVVTAADVRVNSSTAITLSCVISDISQATTSIVWKTSGKADLSNITGHGFTVKPGSFDAGYQTTTLALDTTVVSKDIIYTCDVTPSGGTAQSTEIYVNVIDDFTVVGTNKEVESGTDVTISCVVTGITQAVTAVWKKTNVLDVSSVEGYTVVQGEYSDGTQTTKLTLTGSVNDADTLYTCDVTPSGGKAKSTEMTLSVFGSIPSVTSINFTQQLVDKEVRVNVSWVRFPVNTVDDGFTAKVTITRTDKSSTHTKVTMIDTQIVFDRLEPNTEHTVSIVYTNAAQNEGRKKVNNFTTLPRYLTMSPNKLNRNSDLTISWKKVDNCKENNATVTINTNEYNIGSNTSISFAYDRNKTYDITVVSKGCGDILSPNIALDDVQTIIFTVNCFKTADSTWERKEDTYTLQTVKCSYNTRINLHIDCGLGKIIEGAPFVVTKEKGFVSSDVVACKDERKMLCRARSISGTSTLTREVLLPAGNGDRICAPVNYAGNSVYVAEGYIVALIYLLHLDL